MTTAYVQAERVFRAFCDEKRLRILALLRGGEKSACELVTELAVPQSTLSYHMKILCESGVVDSRQEANGPITTSAGRAARRRWPCWRP